ncbi:CinY protein [Altererythrobacter sp. ZODW24]|uniref:CinY protein n=1 Tax=Altererythrobacter sp. ZODW24 TaxID=2185142 RepID=UPI0013B3E7AD|nr:CinY protein [Altererythrobacter sp. ZODW24]
MIKLHAPSGLKATAIVAAIFAITVTNAPAVEAFGTINGGGQNSEHARITRQALSCDEQSAIGTCFEKNTLDSLAGKKGDFGAVGAPDRGRGMLTSFAHCSGGDYYDVSGYPRSREEAQTTLEECRNYMADNLAHAISDAAKLLNGKGEFRSRQVSMSFGCIYGGSQHGRAKCNILAHFGRILHASQDFYSHSNWVDQPNLNLPVTAKNPPGLGNRGAAPWLDLRVANPAFPAGLISGCFDNVSFLDEERGCLYNEAGDHRVRHANVHKDVGEIGEEIGKGTSQRGAMNENFRHAVEAAIEDSSDKWVTFREALVTEYGAERGEKMICAITHDKPKRDC